ncbi:MAG: transcription termination/antitermination protein NusA [Proteobacteria bacterium]|nr:transcription termination/antitermination protein NusA [Pseudomonadota bacterium]
MNTEFISALKQIEKDRNIPLDMLVLALEDALAAAYKRNFGPDENIMVEINRQNGQSRVFSRKLVVEEVEDPILQMSLEEAEMLVDGVQPGEEVLIEVTPTDFGRIAAQTAKQVIVQRIREAEREIVFSEYARKEGDIVTGPLQRYENRNALIDLGKAEGVLMASEMSPHEYFRHGERVRAYVIEVRRTTRGPQVLLSRTHPALLKRLFELEVPEIRQGLINVKAVVREPGYRSKIAVKSNDPSIDPVGACVGPKGSRVQSVVDELRGEKIDIINWNQNPAVFVSNALSPARVVHVVLNVQEKTALVVVPDQQLSLAIGKEGQNARLAAKLTGWKIDIKSEAQWRDIQREEEARRAEEELQRQAEEAEKARIAAERAALGLPPLEEPEQPAPEAEPGYGYGEEPAAYDPALYEGVEVEPQDMGSLPTFYLDQPAPEAVPLADKDDHRKKKKGRDDDDGLKKKRAKGGRPRRFEVEEDDYTDIV